MKQDKADKIIQKAELKAKKAAQQVEAASKKAEATRKKQEAQAQKKAAKAAAAATKKAAAKTKRAETVAKKAQLAAQKAEEKKAKAMAKAAAKAVGPEKEGEGGEDAGGKKKKSKKKLLLLAIPVVAVAVAVGVFFFLKGRGEKEEAPPEPIAAPAEYVLNEAHITALPVWGDEVLVYQEEVPPEPAQEPEKDAGEDKQDASKDESKDESKEGAEGEEKAEEPKEEPKEAEEGFTKIRYRYEGLKNAVGLVSAYAAVMTAEDAGFSVVDETLLRVEPPEEYAARGSVQLARNVPEAEDGSGGGVQSLLLSWEAGKCSVILDMPEGRVHDPKPEAPAPAAPRRGLSDLESIHPSKLGLPGESMEAYKLIPQEGSFRIANSISTRVNVYGENNQFVGSYFLSADGKLYKLDEEANAVVELDWE